MPLLPTLNEITVGLSDAERRGEDVLTLNVTLPLNPPTLFTLILDAPGEPAWRAIGVAFAMMPKSPAARAFTVALAFGLPSPVG